MPITATPRMQRLQQRWMVDRIRIIDPTQSVDVDPITLQHIEGQTRQWEGCALVRQQTAQRVPGEGRVFGERLISLKVPSAALPKTGDRVTILECRDATLVTQVGTVLEVERDAIRAVRRCTVKMDTAR